jgi:hypothetical protein
VENIRSGAQDDPLVVEEDSLEAVVRVDERQIEMESGKRCDLGRHEQTFAR